jgi:murein DD-endopeptidase MepM/ murein hydrolase activator NlpD
MSWKRLIILSSVGLLAGAIAFLAVLLLWPKDAERPTPAASEKKEAEASSTYTRLVAASVAGAHGSHRWSGEVSAGWQAEAVSGSQAINIYDPAAEGASNLERSQIFVRFFEAGSFLTLSTVTIHERSETRVAGRPAVRYVIEKKPGVADFPAQPRWRSGRHEAWDVRSTDASPTTFYVIAKRPELSAAVYAHFLETFQPISETALAEPVTEFRARITKKKFGIYITPQTSPVQPEKFAGYHTGVDVEFTDVAAEVPVRAIEAGTVLASARVSGYGGVVIIRHNLNGTDRSVLYGHLAPSSLPTVGQGVARGQTIGRLGQGGTAETDGERKHLHFAVLSDARVDYRGYVSAQSQLSGWVDPLSFFK